MNILIKSAKIVAHTQKDVHMKTRDILIERGTIVKIASKIVAEKKVKVVELKNLHVSSGWFDSSVSFGEPGFEERETIENGLQTAAKSGFTDIVLNPNSHPIPDTSSDIVFLKNAAKESLVDLHPLGALTLKSEGLELAELFDMKSTGAVGFYDFKRPVENPNLLKIALQYVQNFNGLVHSFPQDQKIKGKGVVNEGVVSTHMGLKGIPALAEELQLARDIFILEYTNGKLHIPTISTANSVKLIAEAKKKGLNISCSAAIHNLLFTDAQLEGFDSAYKVLPPLRTEKDAKALKKGLKDGTIDFVTTDHVPVNIEEKNVEFDNAAYGSIGLESAFGVLNNMFGVEAAVGLLSKGRDRYGLESPKIKMGQKACITLFDPDENVVFSEDHIHSTSKNSMFIGAELKGRVYGIANKGTLFLK